MNLEEELYLEVVWTKKPCRLMSKVFPLKKARSAYALFERVPEPMIILRGGKSYNPKFKPEDLEREVDLWIYGKYEDRVKKFLEWLKTYIALECRE